MRESAINKPGNAHIISAQLDEQSLKHLDMLCQEAGVSRSRMIRMLIVGASVKPRIVTIKDEPTPVPLRNPLR